MPTFRIDSWEEDIDERVLILSKTVMPEEEQKEKIKSFFLKEFDLDVEELLSLDEIDSRRRYFENFETIKVHLCEMFKEDQESFRYRMHDDDFRRLEEWLLPDHF